LIEIDGDIDVEGSGSADCDPVAEQGVQRYRIGRDRAADQ
jgi:hypothetical protein